MVFKTKKEMLGASVCGPWVIELAGVPGHVIMGPVNRGGPMGPSVDVKTWSKTSGR